MASIYQALDLKNEIEKFKYYLNSKYSKNLSKSVMLNTLNVKLEKLYSDEFLYKVEFIDFLELYTIEVSFRNIGDFEIKYEEVPNDEVMSSIVNEIGEYLNKLFKLNYKMNFE